MENFLSFKDRQKFSMIPGKMALKKEHKTSPVKGISVLKTSVIFGANASGKSNLVKAIQFGKRLVLKGSKTNSLINFQNFRLDKATVDGNSRMEYEIQHKGQNYAYGFVFNKHKIVEEWLYKITKKSDTKIFERNISNKEEFDLSFLLKKNKAEEKQFLKFIAKGTPSNQLFLTEIRKRRVEDNVSNITDLLNILDWFLNSLKIIFPDDKYNEGLKFELKDDEQLTNIFEEFLSYFDTGIDGVALEKVEANSIDIPPKLLTTIEESLLNSKSEDSAALISGNTTYFFSKKENEIQIYEFKTKHHVNGQKECEYFRTAHESDGTNRIIDFIPLLMDLLKGDNVFIIDEMERSLHPNLMYDLIDLFLAKSKQVNSQLILASHESSLLTQKLLRKDEVWFVVKERNGSSKLYSLQEYSIRFDKQIRKDYLLGRFKAIPKIGNREELTMLPNQN